MLRYPEDLAEVRLARQGRRDCPRFDNTTLCLLKVGERLKRESPPRFRGAGKMHLVDRGVDNVAN